MWPEAPVRTMYRPKPRAIALPTPSAPGCHAFRAHRGNAPAVGGREGPGQGLPHRPVGCTCPCGPAGSEVPPDRCSPTHVRARDRPCTGVRGTTGQWRGCSRAQGSLWEVRPEMDGPYEPGRGSALDPMGWASSRRSIRMNGTRRERRTAMRTDPVHSCHGNTGQACGTAT